MRAVTMRAKIAAAVLAGSCVLAACSTQVPGAAVGSSGAAGGSSSAAAPSDVSSSEPVAPSVTDSAPGSTVSSEAGTSSSAPESSSAGTDDTSSEAPGTTSSDAAPASSSAGSSGGSVPSGVAAFAARVQHGISSIKTMKGSMKMAAGPLDETGSFTQVLSGGEVSAMDMTMKVGGNGNTIDMKLRVVGDKSYLGPEATLQKMGVVTNGKPWVELSTSSKNAVLAQMAASMDQTKNTAGLRQYAAMIVSASDFAKVGTEKVDGADATHYKVTIDLAKFAAAGGSNDNASMAAAQKAGLKEIPLDIWLDSADRPVKVAEHFSVQGQTVNLTMTMGDFNVPVSITAPPAKDVAKG